MSDIERTNQGLDRIQTDNFGTLAPNLGGGGHSVANVRELGMGNGTIQSLSTMKTSAIVPVEILS